MGTRSLTRIHEGARKFINMYRQFDGYPSGHGKELFEFLRGMKIINGISGQKAGEAANGAACLAAQMIAKFKDDIGGIYVYPVDSTDCGQDYEYVVGINDGQISIKVIAYGEEKFNGNVEAFGAWCASPDDDED